MPQKHILYTPVDKSGRRINIEHNGLVINKTLADILQVKVGDYISLQPLIGNRVVARVLVSKIIHTYLGLDAYADQVWLSRLLGDSHLVSQVLFKLNNNADKKLFIRRVNKFAPMINLVSSHASQELLIQTFNRFLSTVILVLIGFSGIIAVGSVLNTAMISLNERQRDVASLRVLGFTNNQVAKIFFYESTILNIIGIIFGLGLGIYFAYYMSVAFSTEIYRMPVVIKLIRLGQSALIMLLFVLVSQAVIYWLIRKQDWFAILNVRE